MSSGPGIDIDGPVNSVESDFYKNLPEGMHIAGGIVNAERIEMNPKNVVDIFERTVSYTAEFIEKQKDGVTLVIPMMGGAYLADSLIRTLAEKGYNLENLDIRFAKKVKEKDDETYILDDEITPIKGVRVMIDDIVDKAGAFKRISEKLSEVDKKLDLPEGKTICFTASIKGPNEKGSSTFKHAEWKRFTIDWAIPGQEEYADINYVAILDNEWIQSGFGMNSGDSDDLLQIAGSKKPEDIVKRLDIVRGYTGDNDINPARFKQTLAEIQSLERIAPTCLVGKPEDFAKYGKYLKEVASRYPYADSDILKRIFEIEAVHFMGKHIGDVSEAQQKMKMMRGYFVELLARLQHLQMLEAQSEYRMDLL